MNYKKLVKSVYPNACLWPYGAQLESHWFSIMVSTPGEFTKYLGDSMKSEEHAWELAWEYCQIEMIQRLSE